MVLDRFHHFFHCFADGDWVRPVTEHMTVLDQITIPFRVTCGVVGSPENRAAAINCLPDSWETIEFDSGFEDLTLELIKDRLTDLPVMYAHTKGSGFPMEYSDAWRRCMTRQVVGGWRTNLQALQTYDLVGAHWLTPDEWAGLDSPFFGGNYWWAGADHLRKLGPVSTTTRFASERWIGLAPARVLNLVDGWPGPSCQQHDH